MPVAEALDLRAVVVHEQLVVARDRREVRVQLAVPVDLVEAHVREAEERPARAAADAVGDQVDGLAAGRPSTSRARHAYISASATLGSIDLSIAASRVPMLSTQPGLWNWGRGSGEASRSLQGGESHRRRASARARSSLRHGPWWPASAATACVVSSSELW